MHVVSEMNVVKWKVSKKALKNFPTIIWTGRRVSFWLCVCVCVCLSVCRSVGRSVLWKKLNNFWWNELILLKFSETFQLSTNSFWAMGIEIRLEQAPFVVFIYFPLHLNMQKTCWLWAPTTLKTHPKVWFSHI